MSVSDGLTQAVAGWAAPHPLHTWQNRQLRKKHRLLLYNRHTSCNPTLAGPLARTSSWQRVARDTTAVAGTPGCNQRQPGEGAQWGHRPKCVANTDTNQPAVAKCTRIQSLNHVNKGPQRISQIHMWAAAAPRSPLVSYPALIYAWGDRL